MNKYFAAFILVIFGFGVTLSGCSDKTSAPVPKSDSDLQKTKQEEQQQRSDGKI